MKPTATRVFLALFIVGSLASGAQVNSLRIASAVMKREIPTTVVVPDASAAEPTRKFPTLYLLHGAGDNERGWLERTPVREMADAYGVITVTPAVGTSGASWKLALPRQMAFLGAHLEGATLPKPQPGDADFPQPPPSARHDQKVPAVRSGDDDLPFNPSHPDPL